MSIHPTAHSEAHQAGPPSAQSHAMFHPVLDPALISCRLVLLFQHLFPPAACLRAFYLVVSCLHSDPDPVKHDKYLSVKDPWFKYLTLHGVHTVPGKFSTS